MHACIYGCAPWACMWSHGHTEDDDDGASSDPPLGAAPLEVAPQLAALDAPPFTSARQPAAHGTLAARPLDDAAAPTAADPGLLTPPQPLPVEAPQREATSRPVPAGAPCCRRRHRGP
eukprot:352476-Chlamydomonas_euryale.AAC.11